MNGPRGARSQAPARSWAVPDRNPTRTSRPSGGRSCRLKLLEPVEDDVDLHPPRPVRPLTRPYPPRREREIFCSLARDSQERFDLQWGLAPHSFLRRVMSLEQGHHHHSRGRPAPQASALLARSAPFALHLLGNPAAGPLTRRLSRGACPSPARPPPSRPRREGSGFRTARALRPEPGSSGEPHAETESNRIGACSLPARTQPVRKLRCFDG